VNQGTATLDTSGGALYLYAPAVSGDNWRLLVKETPVVPYTITVAVTCHIYNVNYNVVGIGWRDSNSGKIVTFMISGEAEGTLRVSKYNSVTSLSGNYTNVRFGAYNTLLWLRIADNGTNRICSWSLDSKHWIVFHTISRTDFITPNQVMICGNSVNSTYPCGITVYSWEEA